MWWGEDQCYGDTAHAKDLGQMVAQLRWLPDYLPTRPPRRHAGGRTHPYSRKVNPNQDLSTSDGTSYMK